MGLSSCSTVFDPRACPPVKKYSKQQQEQLGKDLVKSPKSVQNAFVDYGKLRDQSRACAGASYPR